MARIPTHEFEGAQFSPEHSTLLPSKIHLFLHALPTHFHHLESFKCRKQNTAKYGFSIKRKLLTHTNEKFEVDLSQLQVQLYPETLMTFFFSIRYWFHSPSVSSALLCNCPILGQALPNGYSMAANCSKLQPSFGNTSRKRYCCYLTSFNKGPKFKCHCLAEVSFNLPSQ